MFIEMKGGKEKMTKIKKITYKISKTGKWKSKIAEEKYGKNTYPILLFTIEDVGGIKIEIPLSYNQLAEMVEKHIFNERYLDSLEFRKPYAHKVRDGMNMRMDWGYKMKIEDIKEWIKENENP